MERLISSGFTVNNAFVSRNGRHVGTICSDGHIICDIDGIGETNTALLRKAGFEPTAMSSAALAIINAAFDTAMSALGLAS